MIAAMACRDLVKRHQGVYHASIWAGATKRGDGTMIETPPWEWRRK